MTRMVLVGMGFLLAAVGFFIVALTMRPTGAPIRHSFGQGLLANSTVAGRVVGLIALMLLSVAVLILRSS